MSYYLGLEVRERSISAVAISSDGTVLASNSTATSQKLNLEGSFTAETQRDLLDKIIGLLKSMVGDFKSKPSAMGICAQGNVPIAWNSNTLSTDIIPTKNNHRGETSLHTSQWSPTDTNTSEPSPNGDSWAFRYSSLFSQLGNDPAVRVGSVSSWLLATLTQSSSPLMDHSEASKTGLFDITTNRFDHRLCEEFNIPPASLPELKSSNSYFGDISYSGLDFLKGVPIHALVGNEQASLLGTGCISEGEMAASLETDISILSNTGGAPFTTPGNLAALVLWTEENRGATYGLKATAPSIGVTLEWMMKTFDLAPDLKTLENLAKSVRSSDQVTFVPSFGTMETKFFQQQPATILGGLDYSSTKAHIARALFESVAHVVASITGKIQNEGSFSRENLRLVGALSQIDLLNQMVADQTNLTCRTYSQSAPYGVAMLAACALENIDIFDVVQNHLQQAISTPSTNRRGAKSKSDRWDNYIKKIISV